jgi:hypothetical protein
MTFARVWNSESAWNPHQNEIGEYHCDDDESRREEVRLELAGEERIVEGGRGGREGRRVI